MPKIILFLISLVTFQGCIQTNWAVYEFSLEKCPQANYEIPNESSMAEWSLIRGKSNPACKQFLYYELKKNSQLYASVYVRFKENAGNCSLYVAERLPCPTDTLLEKCDDYNGLYDSIKGFKAVVFSTSAISLKKEGWIAKNPLKWSEYEKWCN